MLDREDVRLPVTVIGSLAQASAVHDLLANRAGTGKYVVQVGTQTG